MVADSKTNHWKTKKRKMTLSLLKALPMMMIQTIAGQGGSSLLGGKVA